MKTIYIADDGTKFDDQYDCEDYEWRLNHPYLKDVHAFDKDGNELKNIFSEDTYNYSAKIIVTSDEGLKDLQALADYMGYCYYRHIDGIGEWIFDNHKECFLMVAKG